MEKKAIHHRPTREYSHAWGELAQSRQDLPDNTLANRAVSSENFPLDQLSRAGRQNQKSAVRHFFSLTGIDKSEQNQNPIFSENDSSASLENLESRLYHLQNLLSDYRWTAETEIIDRTSDAAVHLDQMANNYRESVRAELEKFRDETGDKSLLRRSLINSALRRLPGASDNSERGHHHLPGKTHRNSSQEGGPVFFNYFPRSRKRE